MPKTTPCAGCGQSISLGRTSLPPGEATCRPCRRARVVHGTSGAYGRGCRCRTCRDYNASYQRAYVAKQGPLYYQTLDRPGRPRVGPSPCDWCGVPVPAGGRSSADGLRLCGEHRQLKRKADRRRATRRRQAEAALQKAARGRSANRRWVFVQGCCHECEQTFTRRGAVSPYCSKACSRKARRGVVSRRVRLAIYERDAWTCQICHDPVDGNLPSQDNWSPTLDHIVPRSAGGSDDPVNLRLAHRWCNSVRGDLTYYSDEVLAPPLTHAA